MAVTHLLSLLLLAETISALVVNGVSAFLVFPLL
jgi:hypothetical protein